MASGLSRPGAAKKPWHQRAWKSLRKRWVQVFVVVSSGVLLAGIAYLLLAPKTSDAAKLAADKKAGKYKYLSCDKCNMELPYNPELDGKKCSKCKPPKTGFYTPTVASRKDGGGPDPWKWFILAVAFDGLAVAGTVVYLSSLPVLDPSAVFYVFNCPHCAQRLRFRQLALGGIGQCSRCKRPLRFPDEDHAVLESQLLRQEDQERAALLDAVEDDDAP